MRTKHARSIRLGILYGKECLALGLIPNCRDFEFVEDLLAGDSLTLYSFYNYLYSRGFYLEV